VHRQLKLFALPRGLGGGVLTRPRWGHAVVVGGAYAGLLAAHVLVEYFERVTVCERDLIDEDTEFHPGVPQARYPHALLARGAELLEARFSGLRAELAALGAPVYDVGLGMRFRLPSGRRLPVSALGVEVQNVSRTTLERVIRRRVLAHPRIELRAGFVVEGIDLDKASSTVTGVIGRQRSFTRPPSRGRALGSREHFPADFVAEATGRAAKLLGWLSEIGWERPEVLEVADGQMTYVSRFFQLPAEQVPGWYTAGCVTYAPAINRGGSALMLDGDRWLITLIGAGGEVPPTDPASFLDYAASLDMEEIPAVIAVGTPLTSAYRYARTANRWICYHQLRRWPQRLIAVGDAVCVFNPVYGQGLTVAAQQAQLLRELLTGTRTLRGLAPRFQRRAGRLIRLPWSMATSSDLSWDPAPPGRPARLIRWYLHHLLDLTPIDPEVATRFVRVQNMISGPATLLSPRVIIKVLRQSHATRPNHVDLELC
jgi:2-polyprenyl-6-methoxyphenol hydroxylase-like FAD-dependent oxidoreductase